MINVKPCANSLKKPKFNIHIFPEEKSADLFTHIIRMLSPPGALVLDPFGGPLTTSLACIKSDRHCISINPDDCAMKFALGRLRIFVTPDVTMEHLDVYSEEDVLRKEKKRRVSRRQVEKAVKGGLGTGEIATRDKDYISNDSHNFTIDEENPEDTEMKSDMDGGKWHTNQK